MKYALIGNPNSGKTTLFNSLTGSKQHVGNFPGVTVEKKEGILKNTNNITVVDLPGIYSLSPYTEEEVVTRDYLLNENVDLIIDIVDATNIERNLYLTLQLMELDMPMVIALNMMDEVDSNGDFIDVKGIAQELALPIVPISAGKNQGINDLIEIAYQTAKGKKNHLKWDFCSGATHKAIHAVTHLIEDRAVQSNLPLRFTAIKVIEGDALVERELAISPQEKAIIDSIVHEMENNLATDKEAAIVDMRYSFIEELCRNYIQKGGESKERQRSVKIDRLLTHKIWAIPIFLGIMAFIFWLTFGILGSTLSNLMGNFIQYVTNLVDAGLTALGISFWLHSLIIDGVFVGIGSVLSFLPTIIILFFFLSLLEDSGYMARVAFVMDKLLRKIGLSGRSFVPMLIGFGCSVPAILSTRTLASKKDRMVTILLVPFMSCSAKLPIYALFTAAFFPNYQALVMICLYVLGIVMGILIGFLLKKTAFKGDAAPFIMELPAYRLPTWNNIMLDVGEKAKGFIQRAFTVIFLASIVIWFCRTLDWQFNLAASSEGSILASIGSLIAPIFKPLGFGSWQATTALITGLTAKEAVVSTLAVLMGSTEAAVSGTLQGLFSTLSAASFLVFTLLYMPCIATFAVIKKELVSRKKAVLAMLFQTSVAWIVAFIVYRFGLLLGF